MLASQVWRHTCFSISRTTGKFKLIENGKKVWEQYHPEIIEWMKYVSYNVSEAVERIKINKKLNLLQFTQVFLNYKMVIKDVSILQLTCAKCKNIIFKTFVFKSFLLSSWY